MAVTLKDVALAVGVSPMTVSYALRDHNSIPLTTRTRVRAAATEMGYRPNGSARAMRSGRTNAIGLLQATELRYGGLGPYTLKAIQDELIKHDLRLVMSQVPDMHLTDPERMPRILREWSVDGLLISYAENTPPGMEEMLRAHRIPAVWVNAKFEHNAVYPDDFGAYESTTRRLIDLGHRRILYSSWSRADHYSRADRRMGYAAAMTAAGLQPVFNEPAVGREQRLTGEERMAGAKAILSAPDRPTAVVVYGGLDDTLSFVFTGLSMGFRFPRDLSIVGVGDGRMDVTGIDIATLTLPTWEMGTEAMNMLMRKVGREPGDVPSRALPLSLNEHHTFGPPAL